MQTKNFNFYQKDIFTLEEACMYIGISKSTMYKFTSQTKSITFYRPTGKLIYFKRKDLDEFMLQNKNLSMDRQLENKLKELSNR
ncbi:MAG: helix-turn-helix domain-containing protein [Flavobacteriaceae bacterium]|nr:helix-turn-helix domain-containing protein [Flavobacteriaceae bacterium]